MDDDNVSTAFSIVKLVERSDPTNDRKLSKIVHQNDKYSTMEFSFWNRTTRHNHNGFRTFFLFCAIFSVPIWVGDSPRRSVSHWPKSAMHALVRPRQASIKQRRGILFYFPLLRKFIKNELCLCSDAYGQTHERRTLCVIATGNMHSIRTNTSKHILKCIF